MRKALILLWLIHSILTNIINSGISGAGKVFRNGFKSTMNSGNLGIEHIFNFAHCLDPILVNLQDEFNRDELIVELHKFHDIYYHIIIPNGNSFFYGIYQGSNKLYEYNSDYCEKIIVYNNTRVPLSNNLMMGFPRMFRPRDNNTEEGKFYVYLRVIDRWGRDTIQRYVVRNGVWQLDRVSLTYTDPVGYISYSQANSQYSQQLYPGVVPGHNQQDQDDMDLDFSTEDESTEDSSTEDDEMEVEMNGQANQTVLGQIVTKKLGRYFYEPLPHIFDDTTTNQALVFSLFYDSNKITSIKDGDYFIWQSSYSTYAKYVWLYSDTEKVQLIDYIVTSSPSTLIGAIPGLPCAKRDGSVDSDSTISSNLSGYTLPDTKGSNTSDVHGLTKMYTTSTITSVAIPSEAGTALYTHSNPGDTVVATTNRMACPPCYIDGSEEMGFLRIKMYRKGNKWIRIGRTDFYDKLDRMYSILPKLTTEKGKSTIPSNMDKFTSPSVKPKFFAIDLDGTFLTLKTTNFVKNLKAFEKARQSGYYPLICTGRSFGSSFDGFNDLILEHTTYNGYPGVYNNGTVVFDHSGSVIHKTCFSKEYMTKLLAYIQENDAEGEFLFYDLEHYYCLFDSAMVTSKLFLFYNFFKPNQIEPQQLLDIEPVMIYFYKNEPNFGPFVNGVDHISKVTIFQLFTEITPPGVSKSFGVKKLMDHYGLDSDGLFFVGDGENDIEIMDSLNNSFAVGDAPDFVKQHAKYILEDKHTEGAVANLLNLVYDL